MEEVILSLLQYRDSTDTITIYIDGCDNFTFSVEDFTYMVAKKSRKGKSITPIKPISLSEDESSIQYKIGGDALYPVISAASVVAKVTRDKILCDFHEDFPQYGFDTHKGYGTSKHRQALMSYGITPIHRKSYEPMKSLILRESSV